MFFYFNYNPKQKHVRDCVYRAMAYFFGKSWRDAVQMLVDFNCDKGLVNFTHITNITDFMSSKGFTRYKVPQKGMTVGEFVNDYAKEGNIYVLYTIRPLHLTIVDENKDLTDTWDCSDREIKYYWFRTIV